MRTGILAAPLALLILLAVTATAEGEAVKGDVEDVRAAPELKVASRSKKGGNDGYSQQYHYSSQAQHQDHGWVYPGISVDLGQGVFLAFGAILLLLALCAIIPLLDKKDDHGWGWSGSGSGGGGGGGGGGYRSLDFANMSETVLNGIQRVYDIYEKATHNKI